MNLKTFFITNLKTIIKTLAIVLLVILVSVFAARQDFSRVQAFIENNKHFSLLICLFIYAILGATPVPSEPLTVFITSFEGPLFAVIIATCGNTLAAIVEFFIGGRIGDISDFEKRKAQLPFHLGDLPINSPIFLLLGRMLPGFGPKFISIACGVYHVPMFTYLWTTVLSNLAGAIIVAFGGYGLIHLL
ncbi:MAG TPA: VTT domain-containing protein [Leptolinea sp.]